ncbi:MAG: hypothetical protein BA863_11120 [Desulfovibrio sp. S3730MH75]|nr:MAG: hypothetical protein BA863_11120 [Desulfovibrio sp. S3730MH75]
MVKNKDKTEIRIAVDSDFLKKLEKRLKLSRGTDVAKVALSILDWASEETKDGRMILSTTKEGKNAHRLVLPELMQIKSAE